MHSFKELAIFIDKVYTVCVEPGKEYEFTCPVCGGKAKASRSRYNGHFYGSCEQCEILFME